MTPTCDPLPNYMQMFRQKAAESPGCLASSRAVQAPTLQVCAEEWGVGRSAARCTCVHGALQYPRGMHQCLSLLLCGQDMMTEQDASTASMILYMILHIRCPSAWAQMRCDESFHVCLPVSSTEWGHKSPCLPEVPGQNKQTNLAA